MHDFFNLNSFDYVMLLLLVCVCVCVWMSIRIYTQALNASSFCCCCCCKIMIISNFPFLLLTAFFVVAFFFFVVVVVSFFFFCFFAYSYLKKHIYIHLILAIHISMFVCLPVSHYYFVVFDFDVESDWERKRKTRVGELCLVVFLE